MNNIKITDKEIKSFVKELDETNNIIWNAICYTEELLSNKVFQAFRNNADDDERNILLNRIAKYWNEMQKHLDDDFAQPEYNESYFEEFEQFGRNMEDVLGKIECK